MLKRARFVLLSCCLAAAAQAADVRIDNARVTTTAPGQKVGAAFMDLTADSDLALVRAESPAAKVVELHTMRMEGGVMVMRQVKDIPLAKGQTVSLKPGGLHIMLIDLNAPIAPDSSTALSLVFKDAQGQEFRREVAAPARRPGGGMHKH